MVYAIFGCATNGPHLGDASMPTDFATFINDDEEDDEELCTVAAAALFVTAAETARLFRNEKQHPSRNYLTRLDLAPNPRFGTAWKHLFDS